MKNYQMMKQKNQGINKIQQDNSEDDFSDLIYFEKNKQAFAYFEDTKFRSSIGIYAENRLMNKEKDDKKESEFNVEYDDEIIENINKNNEDNFILKTRKMIYQNYLDNYIKKEYKFKNQDFSLFVIFFR